MVNWFGSGSVGIRSVSVTGGGGLWCWLLVLASASKGSAGCMWTGRVEPQDALHCAVELLFCKDGF